MCISTTTKTRMNAIASTNRPMIPAEAHPHVVPSVIAMRNDMTATANVVAPKTSTREGVRMGDSFRVSAAKIVNAIAAGMTVWYVVCHP